MSKRPRSATIVAACTQRIRSLGSYVDGGAQIGVNGRKLAHAGVVAVYRRCLDARARLRGRSSGGRARRRSCSLLTETSRRWLLQTMEGTHNGPRRLKGLLPPGTPVAHKPGTAYTSEMGMSVAINDVGIVTMPDSRRFAIAVMESGSRASFEAQEDTIARLARSAWDALRQ